MKINWACFIAEDFCYATAWSPRSSLQQEHGYPWNEKKGWEMKKEVQ